MQVRALMATDLATVGPNDSLQTAVDIMLERAIGSVIVCDVQHTPLGIVTKSDVLRAASEEGKPLDEIGVSPVMSQPLETIRPTATVQTALNRLAEAGIKRLVIVDDMELIGIVTMTDIALHLPEEVSEVRHAERHREEWTEED